MMLAVGTKRFYDISFEVYGGPRSPFDDKRGGHGLSLPIARRVIERHGGTVWSPPGDKGELGNRAAAVIELPID